MLAYAMYLLYEYVLSLFLIPARPCPMKLWHLCDTRTAAICPLDFSVSQRYVQIKDQGSDLPKQAFSKNGLDVFIAKSGGTRHLQGLTARSGNSFKEDIHKKEGLHVANTLIITLSLYVCSSCFQACVYKKTCLKALQLQVCVQGSWCLRSFCFWFS